MVLGVFLRLVNDLYYKNYKEIIFVFTSQLAFLVFLFGYMDFLIVYKWLVAWGTERDTSLAPSIITQMIDIPLSLGSTSGKPLWN
jgi:V-type H+-transporting ATPase subunit a